MKSCTNDLYYPTLTGISLVFVRTCVHYAAWGGYDKCMKILLSNGADRSVRDIKGRKALDIARYREDYAKKNPPLTREEVVDMHEREWGACISLLEDQKSRIADMEDDD